MRIAEIVTRYIAALIVFVGGVALLTYHLHLGYIFVGESIPNVLGWSRTGLAHTALIALIALAATGVLAAVCAFIGIVVLASMVAFPDQKND